MDGHRLALFHKLVASDDNLEKIRVFLAGGIDPNAQDQFGHTPLHTAAASNKVNIQVFRELINNGANLNLRNQLGLTPLHFAVVYRKGEMVQALLQAGADINAVTPRRITALHYAINNNRSQMPRQSEVSYTSVIELVRMLLQHEGIDVNARDISGETPLVWAISKKDKLVVRTLLARGANPRINTASGESPLHIAFDTEEPCMRIVFLLLRNGASLSSLNRDDQTPIDILIDGIVDAESLSTAKIFVKTLAFLYRIKENIIRNIERNYELGFYFLECRAEATVMRTQVICRKLTVHDFMSRCFNRDQFYGEFHEPCLEIYKPLVDILLTGRYSAYLYDILNLISKYQLWNVLTYNLSLKNEKERLKIFPNLHFFQMCINSRSALYQSLSHWQIFQLILSASNLPDVRINSINPLSI